MQSTEIILVMISWVVTPCSDVIGLHFRGTCYPCLHYCESLKFHII